VISFVETHRSTVLNSAVKDDEFRFVPPKNAKELFRERQ
jgi:outer membrane lipoprotein-sorting protein